MRYLGKEYTGKGVTVAIVDSGIDSSDPRLAGANIEGWSITLGATGHALLSSDYKDQKGHGTEMAVAIRRLAPDAKLVAVKIMGERLVTSAELMAAGIETACKNNAKVINLSLGTPNMGKALLLRDCCANAAELGAVVLAAAHPKGERAYPADLPETIGVTAHPDCPIDKFFFFNTKRFPRKEWGAVSDKFMAHGYTEPQGDQAPKYRGSVIATAYMSAVTACLFEAIPGATAEEVIEALRRNALVPAPEIGYS
jgi:membrane-anchored mycosin MYCP